MITNSIFNPKFSETYVPDLFVGYWLEKPSEGFIFRAGLNYPTFINPLGVGYKFLKIYVAFEKN